MAVYGQLYPFDSAEEDWKTFIERSECKFYHDRDHCNKKGRRLEPTPTIWKLVVGRERKRTTVIVLTLQPLIWKGAPNHD